MYQSMNALNQTPVKGEVKAVPNPNTVSCVILNTSTNSLVAASPVKLISGTSQQYLVDLAGPTDNIFGFVVYGPKINKWKAGDRVEVALTGSLMEMESATDITRGTELEFVALGTLVQAWARANKYIGVALDQATAANQLIRVLIQTALEDTTSSSSSSSSCRSSSSSSRSSSSSSCRSSSSSSSSSSNSSSSSSSSSCRSSSSSSSSSCRSSSSSSSSSSRSSSSSSSSCRSSSSSSSCSSSRSSSSSSRSSSSSSSSSFQPGE